MSNFYGIKNKYLVVNGKGSHLHGHGHYIHSAVNETGLKLFIEIYKLLRSAREKRQVKG